MIIFIILGIVITTILLLLIILLEKKSTSLSKFKLKLDDCIVAIFIMILGGIVGWIFYRSQVMSLLVAILSLGLIREYRIWKTQRYNRILVDEFLELNRMLISELHAGKSVERGYRDILIRLQKEGDNYNLTMQKQLEKWCIQLDSGWSVKEVMRHFAKKTNDKTIQQFSTMFDVAIDNGASLLEVIEMTDRILNDRRQVEREISILISEKKLEQKVLSCAPILLLFTMQQSSYAFISPLYETVGGRIIMTIALTIFILCYFWSKKMTEIEL